MTDKKCRIYCAGPLFNAKERQEMQELATCFEDGGFATFLPQRDGLELSVCIPALLKRGIPKDNAADMVSRAIFALDVYQVIEGCDGIVVNLNGRVPDEGAVSEAAIAWVVGKPVVGYKADARSAFLGQDNPLVAGLFDFRICDEIPQTVTVMRKALSAHKTPKARSIERVVQIAGYVSLGKQIYSALRKEVGADYELAELLCANLKPTDQASDAPHTRSVPRRSRTSK